MHSDSKKCAEGHENKFGVIWARFDKSGQKTRMTIAHSIPNEITKSDMQSVRKNEAQGSVKKTKFFKQFLINMHHS